MDHELPLTPEQENQVWTGAFSLLERSGFRVMDDTCLGSLEGSGCEVDHGRGVVRMGDRRIGEVLARARASNAGDSGSPLAGTPVGGVQPLFRELSGEPRLARTDDLLLSLKIADELVGVRSIAPPLTNSESNPAIEPVESLAAAMKTCKRPLDWFDVVQPGLTGYLVRLGEIHTGVAGSAHFLSGVYCITTPLTFGERVCRCMLERAPHQITTIPTSMPISGANVPISPLAAMAVAVAEIVAGWAVSLALNPQSPLAGLVCSGSMDMATGRARFSSITAAWQDAGVVQVLGEGLRTAIWCAHNYTDACEPGYPAAADKLLKSLTLRRFGAGVGYHQGTLDAGRVYSNEQLAIDIELNELLRTREPGLAGDGLDAMLGPLLESGPDAHIDWLTHPSTLEHMRAVHIPLDLLRPESARDVLQRAACKCKEALARYEPPGLSMGKTRAIDEVVDAARRQFL